MKGVGEGGGRRGGWWSKGASCRREEEEEVKISHGIDRQREGNQEGWMENGKGEETTACPRRGAGPF